MRSAVTLCILWATLVINLDRITLVQFPSGDIAIDYDIICTDNPVTHRPKSGNIIIDDIQRNFHHDIREIPMTCDQWRQTR